MAITDKQASCLTSSYKQIIKLNKIYERKKKPSSSDIRGQYRIEVLERKEINKVKSKIISIFVWKHILAKSAKSRTQMSHQIDEADFSSERRQRQLEVAEGIPEKEGNNTEKEFYKSEWGPIEALLSTNFCKPGVKLHEASRRTNEEL